ncbi:fusion protein [Wenling hoplichthys paramyxovirus]|uniref:Fusion protein n=1 Tax=Wenling hoplichthys paramyxovirus TaxID=2116453 RepID=A0A2P1GN51_9MONO|nr:fusion protein [Wenling hoplichthys paramyxovirus]AVM87398.1 fusion protein [Wenling hoplichthys paramyxovirus]
MTMGTLVFMLLVLLAGECKGGDESCLYPPALIQQEGKIFYNGVPGTTRLVSTDRVICPSTGCNIISDGRLSASADAYGSMDMHKRDYEFYKDKIVSRAGGALVANILRTRANTALGFYESCAEWKIFYEGVVFSPYMRQACTGTNGEWSRMKEQFYTKFYEMATRFQCFKFVRVPYIRPAESTQEVAPGCGAGGTINGVEYITDPRNGTIITSVVTDLKITGEYLMPFCYFVYRSRDIWLAENRGYDSDPFLKVYNEQGETLFDWNQLTDGYGEPKAEKMIKCSFIIVEKTSKITIQSWSASQFITRAAYYFNETIPRRPIQVIESKWAQSRMSDPITQESACRRLGDYCIYFRIGTYLGIFDDELGDLQVRDILSGQKGGGPNFCGGRSYPGGCPASCNPSPFCTDYISMGGATAHMASPYSSYRSFGSLYEKWTLTYPGGESVSTLLHQLSLSMASEWNTGSITPEGEPTLSLLGMDSEISNFETLGYTKDPETTRWCVTLSCENCTNLFDTRTGRPRIAPFVASRIKAEGLAEIEMRDYWNDVSLIIALCLLLALIIWLIVTSVLLTDVRRTKKHPRSSIDPSMEGYVADL